MAILHPIFLLIFGILIFMLFKNEQFTLSDRKKVLAFVCILLIIGAGGRYYVGADYPIYMNMYKVGFPLYTTYADVFIKATFQPNAMEIEWLFVLLNKLCYDLGLSFHTLTFILAAISIALLYSTFTKYSAFPALSFLFYFMALYFYMECGQMRQGLGTAFCLFSIRYIIKRQLFMYLLCMFFALGMHKTAIIFLPAYWLAVININANKWMVLVILSIISAPFEIYSLFGGLISFATPQDVSNAFEGYSNDTYYGNEVGVGFGDAINIMFMILMFVFDKQAEKKIYYYEYFRNFAYFGYCLYFIFRGNEIFATRLPGPYIAFAGYFCATGILMSMTENRRKLYKVAYLGFFLFMYVIFANGNGKRGSFTIERYKNVLWTKIDG